MKFNNLEQQLAAQIEESPKWQGLYQNPNGTYAYVGACRDVTTVLSNDNIMLFSGILSKYIKLKMDSQSADVYIWKLVDDLGTIVAGNLDVYHLEICELNGWQLRTSKAVMDQLQSFRAERPPI